MLLKLILILVIASTSYTVAVFQAPEIADQIGAMVWLEELNQKIRDGKNTYDTVVTDIPSKTDLLDTYSWALGDAKDLTSDLKDKIDLTKDKIDTVRGTLWEAEQKYNDIKQTVDDTKEFIDTTTQKIDQVKWTLEQVSEISNKIWEVTEVFSSSWSSN